MKGQILGVTGSPRDTLGVANHEGIPSPGKPGKAYNLATVRKGLAKPLTAVPGPAAGAPCSCQEGQLCRSCFWTTACDLCAEHTKLKLTHLLASATKRREPEAAIAPAAAAAVPATAPAPEAAEAREPPVFSATARLEASTYRNRRHALRRAAMAATEKTKKSTSNCRGAPCPGATKLGAARSAAAAPCKLDSQKSSVNYLRVG